MELNKDLLIKRGYENSTIFEIVEDLRLKHNTVIDVEFNAWSGCYESHVYRQEYTPNSSNWYIAYRNRANEFMEGLIDALNYALR